MSDTTPVAPMIPSKKSSPVTVPADEESTVMLSTAQNVCVWNDQEFPDGARVCSNETVYECSYGKWVKTNESC